MNKTDEDYCVTLFFKCPSCGYEKGVAVEYIDPRINPDWAKYEFIVFEQLIREHLKDIHGDIGKPD